MDNLICYNLNVFEKSRTTKQRKKGRDDLTDEKKMRNDGQLKIAITKKDAKENFDLFVPKLKRQVSAAPEWTEAERIELLLRQ